MTNNHIIPFRLILQFHQRTNPSPFVVASSSSSSTFFSYGRGLVPAAHRESRHSRFRRTSRRFVHGGRDASSSSSSSRNDDDDDDDSTTAATKTTTTHRHAHRATLRGVHPLHLYRIINDVDEYSNFLPYCRESRVLRSSDCGTMYDAILRVGLPTMTGISLPGGVAVAGVVGSLLPSLEERYVSRVRTGSPPPEDDDDDASWTVEAKSIRSNSFDSLRSRWELTFARRGVVGGRGEDGHDDDDDVDVSCDVDFEVEIRVADPLISLVLDGVLGGATRCRSYDDDDDYLMWSGVAWSDVA
ncbi:hypothetical protein ACHAXA_009987 [Cyclostephanos tholiformis]|uniref:Coenzyme Q-binding protein COQ10 START domain-containing protein n=1 Tax=Cyclostephanos tholiformis TaxID=382380 RepID=A0ABD3RSW7_9STRA